MHVLILTSTFPANDDEPVPAFVRDQIIAMKAARPDMRFSVLAPHNATSGTVPFARRPAYDEYRFHYFWPFHLETLAGRGIMPALRSNPANYALVPFLLLGEIVAATRLTVQLRPDVIYAHWFTPQGITAGVVNALLRTPFVFTSHSSDVAVLGKVPVLGRWIVRRFSARAMAITVVSRRSLEKLRRFFADTQWPSIQRKTQVIPMGVTLDRNIVATADVTMDTTRSNEVAPIVFIGRLVEKKGVQYLLPAYAQLRRMTMTLPPLIIAGDGPWRDQLQQMVASLDLPPDVVQFPGFVSGAAKQRLIASAGLVVVPSTIAADGDAEGLPVTLLEGLAAGKVCIATRESGADDVLDDGRNGILVDHQNVDALAAAMAKGLSLDPIAKAAMVERALTTAERFGWPVVAAQHHQHLFAPLQPQERVA